MEKETALEKISGSLAPNAITTLIAASSGAYFAPLLPVLLGSLASERHKKRVENTINELEKTLSELKAQVKSPNCC